MPKLLTVFLLPIMTNTFTRYNTRTRNLSGHLTDTKPSYPSVTKVCSVRLFLGLLTLNLSPG